MDKQSSKFRLSFKVNAKQILIIIFTLIILASIPILISFLLNPEGGSVMDRVSHAFESFKLNPEGEDSTKTFTIPLIDKDVNISVLHRNPQLVIFIGIALIIISIVTVMRLARRKIKVNSNKAEMEEKKEDKKEGEKEEVKEGEKKEGIKKQTLPPLTDKKSTLP